jgi:hypothetical protein
METYAASVREPDVIEASVGSGAMGDGASTEAIDPAEKEDRG